MSQSSATPEQPGASNAVPAGIGGWLLFPVIHLIANLAFTGAELAGAVLRPLSPTGFAVSALMRNALWPGDLMLLGLRVFDIFYLVYAAYCLRQIFRRSADAPSLAILFYAMLFARSAAYTYFLYLFPEMSGTPDGLGRALLSLAFISAAGSVWTAYFLLSERVRNTFVH